MITRTPESKCLYCGAPFSAATSLHGDYVPKPGDVIVCIKCGSVHKIADDLTVRAMTDDEIAEIKAQPELIAAIAQTVQAVRMVRARKN